MLTIHIKEIFLVFSKFCKFLFVFSHANFYGFSDFLQIFMGFVQAYESSRDK